MKITIKELSLRNFKGIKALTLSNLGNEVFIKGGNATGKTTINDAFRYLMFGKNSDDKADFNIKTLTPDGQPIHFLEHEVVGVLDVDGVPTTFKRVFKEKYVKPRGQAETIMQGHETTFFYNAVPLSQREYMSKIDAICPESHFKLLTDPSCFPTLPWARQREIVFGLVPSITDMDIAQGNPEFIALLEYIRTKNISVTEYKKELAAKRTKLKDELEKIPTRIDEAFKGMPDSKDWAFLEQEIADGEEAIKIIDEFITGKTTAQSGVFAANQKIQDQKNALITRRNTIEFEVKTTANKVINDAKAALDTIKFNISAANTDRNRLVVGNSVFVAELKKHDNALGGLREEWRKVNTETLTFKEYDFCCPTCAREYDAEKYETIQATMTATFNENKATRLSSNETTGNQIAKKVKELQAEIEANNLKIEEYDKKLIILKSEQVTVEEVIPAGQIDIQKLLKDNMEFQTICTEIDSIIVPEAPVLDIAEQKAKKELFQTGINNARKLLNDKDTIDKTNARIEELKAEQSRLAQAQADIEAGEFVIQNFEKAKIETIEAKVNGMFQVVKFKMFEQQLNGGEAPTCVCTVDGVPYPDLNGAMKINAGLDIIKTLSLANNVYAPIFIDNRESVNTLAECQSQIINLIVTQDKQLTLN